MRGERAQAPSVTVTLVPHAGCSCRPGHQVGRVWGRKGHGPEEPDNHQQPNTPNHFSTVRGGIDWPGPGGPRGSNLFIATPGGVGGGFLQNPSSPWPQLLDNSHLFPPGLHTLYPPTPASQRREIPIPQHRLGLFQIVAS